MTLATLLTELRDDPRFIRHVTAWRTLPTAPARTAAWPVALDARLSAAGNALGITRPYIHQTEAAVAALRGENVVLATGTASGKTLGFVLPILQALLDDPTATALLLYPTKALAHDQMAALERWIGALNAPLALRPYDGDTPTSRRAAIRKEARLLVTNPDMLHLGILPHHTQWVRFLSGLRYVVVDELHVCRGIFGSHIANVLRRLRRVARFYGAEPRLLATSATIANPRELGELLWGDPVTLVEEDGAPYGERHVLFYNPPLLNAALGLRASAHDEATALTARLLRADVQTIVFTRSRLGVELLLRDLRTRAARVGLDPETVRGYRGGYLPAERREIERGLRTGRVRAVVATNALELGIDIGDLEAAILVGYPGSIAATRQQMGRAGRRAGSSLAVFVATPAPLDQYLVAHPEYFFGRSPEEARINPDTLNLLAAHLVCAAFELPFEAREAFGRVPNVTALLEALSEEGLLHRSNGHFTWVGDAYPAQAISLRSASANTVVVQVSAVSAAGDRRSPTADRQETGSGRLVATVDRASAPLLVHEGAVYFHEGAPYLVERLDWEQGIAHVRAEPVDYYTVAAATTQIEPLAVRRTGEIQEPAAFQLTDEEVRVHIRPTAYRRVALETHETLGWGEITLPEQSFETEAFRLTLGEPLVTALADEGIAVAPLDYGPEWPAIREQIVARDGGRCRRCGAASQPGHPLEVHHLTPLRTFLAQYPRAVALQLAHAPENLLTLCPECHRQVERARGARTALGGLAYLLRNLAPVFLMCDPADLGTAVEARDIVTGQPAVILYDAIPGGVGLTPRLVGLWPHLAAAASERIRACECVEGCPSCVGPVGESEPGAKHATRRLLELV